MNSFYFYPLKTVHLFTNGFAALLAALLAVCFLPATSLAAIVQVNSVDGTSRTFYPVSATDLINDGQPTFSGQTTTGAPAGGSNATNLNDGSAGASSGLSTGAYYPAQEWTTTFDLDTTTNALGYDITGIDTFSGWTNANVWQTYELLVSVVGDASFTSLGTISIVPFNILGNSDTSVRFELTDDTGTIATGVDAVRFTFPNESASISAVYREIDVIGTATTAIPEPNSMALFALGLFGMAPLRKRRNRS